MNKSHILEWTIINKEKDDGTWIIKNLNDHLVNDILTNAVTSTGVNFLDSHRLNLSKTPYTECYIHKYSMGIVAVISNIVVGIKPTGNKWQSVKVILLLNSRDNEEIRLSVEEMKRSVK